MTRQWLQSHSLSQRFCKPKVGGSNPSPGTSFPANFRAKSRTQIAPDARTKQVSPDTRVGTVQNAKKAPPAEASGARFGRKRPWLGKARRPLPPAPGFRYTGDREMKWWPVRKRIITNGDLGHRGGSEHWALGVRCAADWARRVSPEAADEILRRLEEDRAFAARPANQ